MTGPGGSIAFDRAAGYYDRTRALTPQTAAAVRDLLAAELAGLGRVLEIGVGTGRIALPLAEAGVPLVGLDLSRPMLDRLVQNAGGRAPFPVVQADATALPFGDGSFGAAVAVHVLHLVPGWREAVRELVRAVRPGGRVLVDAGLRGGPLRELRDRFAVETGRARPDLGLGDREDLDRFVESVGGTVRALPRIEDDRTLPIETIIARYERGLFSFAWPVEEDERHRAGARLRAWAAGRFGSLTEPRRINDAIEWRAYDLPR